MRKQKTRTYQQGLCYDEAEKNFEWRKWVDEIPYINFPSSWDVKIIPPFGRAIARFLIKDERSGENRVSVYLDCYDEIGLFGAPYWEIYPIGDDIDRVFMEDTDSLIRAIQRSLDQIGE